MVKALYIKQGESVTYEGDHYVIIQRSDLRTVLARNVASDRLETLNIHNLEPYSISAEKPQTSQQDLAVIPNKDWNEAHRRLEIIEPLLKIEKHYRVKEEVKKRAKEFDLHWTTLYNWLSLYEQTENLSSLIPSKGGGKGKHRVKQETDDIMNDTIKEFYLSVQRHSIPRTIKETNIRCKAKGLTAPHPNTIRNRIAALSDYEVTKARFGDDAAAKYEAKPDTYDEARFPLSIVQFDGTTPDIIIVSDKDRLPIGRPYIITGIDVYSHVITGFYVSLDPPSVFSFGVALTHSMLPKEEYLAGLGIDDSWPVFGQIKAVHTDNASEYTGSMVERAFQEWRIDMIHRPVSKKEYGGHIENLFKNLAQRIHEYPGTTFANINERGEYDSEAHATLTLKEFEKLLVLEILDYHDTVQKGIKTTPLQRYTQSILGEGPNGGLPRNESRVFHDSEKQKLILDFLPYEERTVQTNGIKNEHITYYDEPLRPYIHARNSHDPKHKKQFIIRVDPRDISTIYFFEESTNTYHPIRYRNRHRPALTLWEWRAEIREMRRNNIAVNEENIFRRPEQKKEIISSSQKETKSIRRKDQRKRNALAAPKPKDTMAARKPAESEQNSSDNIQPFEDIEHG